MPDNPVPRRRRPLLVAAAVGVLAAALMLTLTTQAFAATLFSDDFTDGNADGWSKSGGSWSVVSDGSNVYRQSSTGADAKAQAGTATWTNYGVQARVKPIAFNGANRFAAVLSCGGRSVTPMCQDFGNT
jgi:pectate lyase